MKIQPKKILILAGMLLPFGVALTTPSFAQGDAASATSVQSRAPQGISREMRASQLLGKQVKNLQGEGVGKIEDLVVDLNGERVYYALLSFGGLLGVGDKQFLFPVSEFKAAGGDQLVLDVDKDRLKAAPGFDPKNRPSFHGDNWRRDVDRYYKIDAARQAPSGARMVSAAQLVNAKVNERSGISAGRLADIVVNFGTGRAYPVLARKSDGKLVALPFHALSFPSRPDLPVMLNVDNQQINSAPAFDDGNWPDLNAPDYQREIAKRLLSFQIQSKANPAQAQTGRKSPDQSPR